MKSVHSSGAAQCISGPQDRGGEPQAEGLAGHHHMREAGRGGVGQKIGFKCCKGSHLKIPYQINGFTASIAVKAFIFRRHSYVEDPLPIQLSGRLFENMPMK